jgi:hypothetical protein
MTTPERATSEGAATDLTQKPIMTLRGAGVDANVHRVGRVVVGLCVVALAASIVVFFIAGMQKNSQINRLRQHGVNVTVTVTGCLGLMGGSGSNAAGYACRGSFSRDGHSYTEAIPGSTFYAPGATLRAVTVPGDPALLSPVRIVASEHASWKVFILPIVLLAILVLLSGAVLVRRRRNRHTPPVPPPGG